MEQSEILELVKKQNKIIKDVEIRAGIALRFDPETPLIIKQRAADIINEMNDEEINAVSALAKAIETALED